MHVWMSVIRQIKGRNRALWECIPEDSSNLGHQGDLPEKVRFKKPAKG